MKHCPTCRWGPSCQLVMWVQVSCKEGKYWRWEEKIGKGA